MVVLEEESENQCINKRYSLRRLSNKQLGENMKHQDTKVTEICFIAWVAKRIQLEIASYPCPAKDKLTFCYLDLTTLPFCVTCVLTEKQNKNICSVISRKYQSTEVLLNRKLNF